MAIWRVDSAASGADDGTSWTDAFSTLLRALDTAINTGLADGDFIYFDEAHTENNTSSATYNNSQKGTIAKPLKILCVDKDDDSLSIHTTTTISTNVSSSVGLTFKGNFYMYGARIKSGSNIALSDGNGFRVYEQCEIGMLSASANRNPYFGVVSSSGVMNVCTWINTDYVIELSGQAMAVNGSIFRWIGGKVILENSQTTLDDLFDRIGKGEMPIVRDVDLSDVDNIIQQEAGGGKAFLENCKMKSGFTMYNADITDHAGTLPPVILQNCYVGTDADPSIHMETQENRGKTIIDEGVYRDGGFKDPDRTNPVSIKALAGAGDTTKLYSGLDVTPKPIVVWSDGDGTEKTYTIEFASDTTYQDDQVWAEFVFPSEEVFEDLIVHEIGGTGSGDIGGTVPNTVNTPGNNWDTIGSFDGHHRIV